MLLKRFIKNGLNHANTILAHHVFDLRDWKVVGEYVYDEYGGRHQAFLSPTTDIAIEMLGTTIKQAERVKIEQSLKYSQTGLEKLWHSAALCETHRWQRGQDYGLYLLKRIDLPFSSLPSEYGSVLPTLKDWYAAWQVWDLVTRNMLPQDELNEKPIRLRNAYIFYLGHIPAFLSMQLDRVTTWKSQQQLVSPSTAAYYRRIFERGIDPDVDDPSRCHDHSEIPDEWPPVDDILAYQAGVRARLEKLYLDAGMGDCRKASTTTQKNQFSRTVARAVWVAFEHELLHTETLLYMMLQSGKTRPPPHIPTPDFAALAATARASRMPDNAWIRVPAQNVIIGMDDPEDGTDMNVHFGWDNEKPARRYDVPAFEAKARPITNEEYANYLYRTKNDQLPASWSRLAATTVKTNGNSSSNSHSPVRNGTGGADSDHSMQLYLRDKAVRTVYGPVPLKYALDWPVAASYDELAGCAAWMGGRIPTMEEARSIYTFVDKQKEASMHSKLANRVPAVNAHLVNDGVEETPPSLSSSPASSLLVDLQDANVGFKTWHPQPVTAHGDRLAGHAEMGGVWEWTSTPLARHPGFEPMALYPAYTTDFFDGKHNVVLGGSWATHPRIAGRQSFVNWYQRNYPFAWAGARLVRDV